MSIIIYHDAYVNIRRGSAEKGAQTTEKTESRAKMYTPDFVPPNRVGADLRQGRKWRRKAWKARHKKSRERWEGPGKRDIEAAKSFDQNRP
jgi:hypothetical protein